MVIGPNFVFIAVPRTASNTMARLFLPQFGGVSNHRDRKHHERIVPPAHEHKFTFAVVRNPYDRMLSCYYHLGEGDKQFGIKDMTTAEFMRLIITGWGEGGWCQKRFLGAARIDMVLRWESLAEEVKRLPFCASNVTFPTQRLSMSKPVTKDFLDVGLTPEFIALVNEHSADDFDAYGYRKLT